MTDAPATETEKDESLELPNLAAEPVTTEAPDEGSSSTWVGLWAALGAATAITLVLAVGEAAYFKATGKTHLPCGKKAGGAKAHKKRALSTPKGLTGGHEYEALPTQDSEMAFVAAPMLQTAGLQMQPLMQPQLQVGAIPQFGVFMPQEVQQPMAGGLAYESQQQMAAGGLLVYESQQQCLNCGNIFMEDSNFCRRCGAGRPNQNQAFSVSSTLPNAQSMMLQPPPY